MNCYHVRVGYISQFIQASDIFLFGMANWYSIKPYQHISSIRIWKKNTGISTRDILNTYYEKYINWKWHINLFLFFLGLGLLIILLRCSHQFWKINWIFFHFKCLYINKYRCLTNALRTRNSRHKQPFLVVLQ